MTCSCLVPPAPPPLSPFISRADPNPLRAPPPLTPFISRADPTLSIQLSNHHGKSRTDTGAAAASNPAECFASQEPGGRRPGAEAGGPLRCKLYC